MAVRRHIRKVGAQSNQETRPCDTASPRSTVAPDSQPPTGRKRKHRTLSPEEPQSQSSQHQHQSKKRHLSESGRDRAKRSSWDILPRVWLASDALRELDRRNALLAKECPGAVCKEKNQVSPETIEQFALHGGPDLSDLRQYSDSPTATNASYSMTSRSGTRSGKAPRSSAYSPNFVERLGLAGVSAVSRSHRAANHREWNEVLIQPRPSMSPSRMSDGHYDRFVKAIDDVENEDEVMSRVFTKIVGEPRHPSRQNVQLGNLEPLADDLVIPQPDYYEGERIGPGNRQLRNQLNKSIVPSSHTHYPFLPTFFTEVKGPDGSFSVGQRQACHDGALGARAMHRVENLGRRREVYDNKARTASVVCDAAGHLDIYNHHISRPQGKGQLPQTHMTPFRSFSLADSPDTFRQGVSAFRNASDYAHKHRQDSIKAAHRRSGIITPKPLSPGRRPALTPLSCQTSVAESSDSETSSSSEDDESDNGNQRVSFGPCPKRKLPSPKIVTATPKRLGRRDSSPPRRELRPRRGTRRS